MQEGGDGTDAQPQVLGTALTTLSWSREKGDKLPQETLCSTVSSQGCSGQLSLDWQPQASPRGKPQSCFCQQEGACLHVTSSSKHDLSEK